MAMPFYVVQANAAGISFENVAMLLAAQTTGALISNAVWGWWGDSLGKCSLLRAIAAARVIPPSIVLFLAIGGTTVSLPTLSIYALLFFVLGALANGLTIAVIGFLMEISPDDRRPAYSGYFNAITAPAFLLPLFAGVLATFFGLLCVFAISLGAAVIQTLILMRIDERSVAIK